MPNYAELQDNVSLNGDAAAPVPKAGYSTTSDSPVGILYEPPSVIAFRDMDEEPPSSMVHSMSSVSVSAASDPDGMSSTASGPSQRRPRSPQSVGSHIQGHKHHHHDRTSQHGPKQAPKLAKARLTDPNSRGYLLQQLQCGVAFGYGLFHIGASIVSPNVLRLLKILGFQADRSLGLRCLRMVCRCDNTKGPVAT